MVYLYLLFTIYCTFEAGKRVGLKWGYIWAVDRARYSLTEERGVYMWAHTGFRVFKLLVFCKRRALEGFDWRRRAYDLNLNFQTVTESRLFILGADPLHYSQLLENTITFINSLPRGFYGIERLR